MTQVSDRPINIREIILRDSFTNSEKFHFAALFVIFLTLTWSLDNQSIWASCFILLLGLASIITVKVHELVHPFHIDRLWQTYLSYNLPTIAFLCFYFLSGLGNGLSLLSVEEREFLYINRPIHLLNTNLSLVNHSIFFVAGALTFSLTTQLLIIPKSLYFLIKLLSWCCISAAFTAFLGYFFKAANLSQIPFVGNSDQSNFFAFFSNDAHWASFALLWMFVSFFIALVEQEKDNQTFYKSSSPLYLGISFILGSTVVVLEASVASFFLALSSAYLCFKLFTYYKSKKDSVFKKLRGYTIAFGLFSLFYSLYILFQINAFNPTLSLLKSSALNMSADSPFFGWGLHSFKQLLPFYGNPQILNQIPQTGPTATLNFLVEYGWVGTGIIILTLVYFFFNYTRSRVANQLTDLLLLALLLTILTGFFENPFYNGALNFSFMLIGFSSIRWSKLFNAKADEVDTNIKLFVPDELRNVPVVTHPKKEVLK